MSSLCTWAFFSGNVAENILLWSSLLGLQWCHASQTSCLRFAWVHLKFRVKQPEFADQSTGLMGSWERENRRAFLVGLLIPVIGCKSCHWCWLSLEKLTYFFPSIPVESWCAPERSGLDGERVIWQQDVQLARVFCPELSPRVRSISCQIYLFYFNLAIDLSDFCLELHVPFWFWAYSLQYPPSSGKKKHNSLHIWCCSIFFHQLRTAVETPAH